MKKSLKKPAAQMPALTIILQGPKGAGKTQLAEWLRWVLSNMGCRGIKATDGGEDMGSMRPSLDSREYARLRDTLEKRNIRIYTVQG